MLGEICKVRDECHANISGPTPDLGLVHNIFTAYTNFTDIEYIGYKVNPSNPILGQFLKRLTNRSYVGPETFVEIRNAEFLNQDIPMKRFVICKETCHALDANEGNHSTSSNTIAKLILTFSLQSASQLTSNNSPVYHAELLAEFGAYEILCPVKNRLSMVASGEYGRIGPAGVAQMYDIPVHDIANLFQPNMLQACANLFP